MFQPDDLVCDVLTNYPQTWDVFIRHGICKDCQQSPPPVPVMHFVNKHCGGQIELFLQELKNSVQ